MQESTVLGLKISYYRKLKGLTQAELAERVGVSSQAISKWEQQINCPDIMLLPELSKILGVTIDELFGNDVNREIVIYSLVNEFPWNDDGKLRIALCDGRKLIWQNTYECVEGNNVIDVRFHGDGYTLGGVCRINCIKDSEE